MIISEATSIFPMFARNFELLRVGDAPSDDESGGYFASENQSDSDMESKQMCEPILPANSGNSLTALLQAGGSVNEYAYQWWSLDHYPKGTMILYHGAKLVVDKSDDYSEEGGFWIYYLKGRDDYGVQS